MHRKLAKSGLLPRPGPSAMFDTTETAALRICEHSPKTSLFGKLSVARYTLIAITLAFCHTSRSRYVFANCCSNFSHNKAPL